MAMTSDVLKQYIWKITGDDPRYSSFLKAHNIDFDYAEMERQSKYDKLIQKHEARINKYLYFWDLYMNNHWFNLSEENIERMKVNYAATMVDKHASFLMNKGFIVESDFPEIQEFLQNNWKMNNGSQLPYNSFGWNLALMGGVSGDAWINIHETVDNINNQRYYKYDILRSNECFPIYSNRKLIGFLNYGPREFVEFEDSGFSDYKTKNFGFYQKHGLREIIQDEEVVTSQQLDYLDIPIVHIKNAPNPMSLYGVSDLMNIAELNLLFDRLSTDMQDIIDYHAQPVTIVKGGRGSELTRSANKVWSLPNKEMDIKNLELQTDLKALTEHLENVKESISVAGKLPDHSLGKKQNISNTSGAALAIMFMPLYETMELKRIMYGTGLLKVHEHTLKMAFMRGDLSPNKIVRKSIKKWKQKFNIYGKETQDKFYPFSKRINVDESDFDSLSAIYNNELPKELFETFITWFPPLPRDEKALSDMSIANVKNGLWSKKYARKLQGIDEKRALLMEEEINKEFTKRIEQEEKKKDINFNEETTVTNKTGLEGDPDVKGEKESQRVENKD